jgi:hypothetical protein
MAELQLDPKKTALVLIDLQNAVVGMNPAPHSSAQVVENSRKLADAFRVHGAPVVYVRVDLNDFMKLPVDQPHNLGDKPLPAPASAKRRISPTCSFHVCIRCGDAFRREVFEGRSLTSGVFAYPRCGAEGPLNIEIREVSDSANVFSICASKESTGQW